MRVMEMIFSNPDIVRTMYDSKYNSNGHDTPLDQLMDHSVRYWEGAVEVSGSHRGKGYLELSGYTGNP